MPSAHSARSTHPATRSQARRSRFAFTLIELLVVVAIISVLAAMLLPALSAARAKAKVVACSNQFRQIVMGATMYSDDAEVYPTLNRAGYNLLGHYNELTWSAGDMTAKIDVAALPRFSANYLAGRWSSDGVSRMRIPSILVCPDIGQNEQRECFVQPGHSLSNNPTYRIGENHYGGTELGFASFLGHAYNGVTDWGIHSDGMRPTIIGPDDVLVIDKTLARISPLGLWSGPHMKNGRPTGMNEAFADGSVRFYAGREWNIRAGLPYEGDRNTQWYYYAPPKATFNRGGYGTWVQFDPSGWWGSRFADAKPPL